MEVLVYLARHPGQVVGRDELIRAVWRHPHVTDEALTRCISMLRHALGDDRNRPQFLETIPKRGYRLIASVTGDSVRDPDAIATVAVLPFLNLSGDVTEEYVADGITELLISNLACLPSLRVISRTSSMHYKGTHERLADIARELGVTRVIEGSVLRSARQLQVVVQVVDPATDLHLFTRTYTRAVTDLLRLQNEIAWVIAGEVSSNLTRAERHCLPQARPITEDAMQAYLRARHFWSQRTPEGFQKAIREYEACIALEAEFAPAQAGLATTLVTMAFYGIMPPAPLFERARVLAKQALALDSVGAETLTVSGGIELFAAWDLGAAEALFRRAVAVNPSYDVARLGLADALLFGNDFDAALGELHLAVRVNPFDLGLQMNVGQFLGFAGRHDEAVAQLQRTLDMGPHFWPARCLLAETLANVGQGAAAKAQLGRASEDIPVARIHQPRAIVHALLGERSPALALLAELERNRESRYVPCWELARGYAALGEADRAFHWIDLGIEERSPLMLGMGITNGFDRIRHDPRFAACLARIGLPVS
jgi:TolB-like protein/tetratricopeptide (TPR) repeat protein